MTGLKGLLKTGLRFPRWWERLAMMRTRSAFASKRAFRDVPRKIARDQLSLSMAIDQLSH